MTVNVSPQVEARIVQAAKRNGVDAAAVVEDLVSRYLPEPTNESDANPTLALFAKWREEDAKMTDAEREAEDKLWDDFLHNLNETRASLGMEPL